MDIKRRGVMLILSSPSGAGKTTLSKLLLQSDDNTEMSISVTTRAKRPNEIDGVDYHFVTEQDFEQKIDQKYFYEYAEVFGHFYGTPRAKVEDAIEQGKDVLFDIDWQGTRRLISKARDDIASIFILPPSMQELERRLHSRAQDNEEIIKRRMARANDEISHWAEYDYVIINESLESSLERIKIILQAERQKRTRSTGLARFVGDVLGCRL